MSPHASHAAEQIFHRCLMRVAAAFAKAVGKIVYPQMAKYAKPDPTTRTDADDDEDDDTEDEDDGNDVSAIAAQMRSAAAKALPENDIRASSDTAAKRSLLHSQKEFVRIGITLPKGSSEPKLKWLSDGWRTDNVARIKGMQANQLDKIEKLLAEGQGMRHETLAKEIARQVEDVTASRCEQIARSQTLRLNGQITRERQTAYGIEQFIWSTSQDERVREEHADLEGETFDWDEGDPEEGFPGDSENCRCCAFPLLPELSDDDSEGDEAE